MRSATRLGARASCASLWLQWPVAADCHTPSRVCIIQCLHSPRHAPQSSVWQRSTPVSSKGTCAPQRLPRNPLQLDRNSLLSIPRRTSLAGPSVDRTHAYPFLSRAKVFGAPRLVVGSQGSLQLRLQVVSPNNLQTLCRQHSVRHASSDRALHL